MRWWSFDNIAVIMPEDPRLGKLIAILKSMGSAVIAYSGGVDSTFLVKAAALSGIRVLAVTGFSPTMPEQDFLDAKEAVKAMGVRHMVIETSELERDDFRENPPDRCFHCKSELFGRLRTIAESEDCSQLLDGSNLDDVDDWRPGRRAALENGVRSPLIEAGLRKQEIRDLSRALNLPIWNKPSSPCLSSRFPYGEPITIGALKRVEAAERFLKSLGFTELRVRHHGNTARIELREDDIPRITGPEMRVTVTEKLRSLGYAFVSLDLEGFRSGKMNILRGDLKVG
jgi:uncharacterized protein